MFLWKSGRQDKCVSPNQEWNLRKVPLKDIVEIFDSQDSYAVHTLGEMRVLSCEHVYLYDAKII